MDSRNLAVGLKTDHIPDTVRYSGLIETFIVGAMADCKYNCQLKHAFNKSKRKACIVKCADKAVFQAEQALQGELPPAPIDDTNGAVAKSVTPSGIGTGAILAMVGGLAFIILMFLAFRKKS